MSNLKLKQQYALDMLKKKFNVFLSGEAGTGKSFVIDKFTEYLDSNGIKYVVCAPTGLAALNVNGTTLHRTFGLSIDIGDSKVDLNNVEDAEVIIIDEISMCRRDIFQYIANALLEFENPIEELDIKRESKICRKKQIVVVGDFFQLPPFVGGSDKEKIKKLKKYDEECGTDLYKHITDLENTLYAFECDEWKRFNFKSIVLDEVVRQSDKNYIDNLNKIRIGDPSGLEFIRNNSKKTKSRNAIYITGTNATVDTLNEKNLEAINDKTYYYEATEEGIVESSDKPIAQTLKFKVGARVMSIINVVDKDKKNKEDNVVVVNGMLGTVTYLDRNSVTVKFDNGYEHTFEKHKWSIKGFKKVTVQNKVTKKKTTKMVMDEIGSYSQIPLKLAWAITIHKSQGQSYEAVNLDPYAFAPGQLYVALSRAKNIQKLHLTKPLKDDYLKTSEVVKEFYKSIETDIQQEEYTGSTDVEGQAVQQENTGGTVGVQEINNLEDAAISLELEEGNTGTVSMAIPKNLVWKVEALLNNEMQLKEVESNESKIKDLRKIIATLDKEVSRLKLELEQAKSPIISSSRPVTKEVVAPNEIDIEKILRLKKHGLDIAHIARMCKTDVSTVNKVLSKYK